MSKEWQSITSKGNALVVKMAKLKDKKYRKSEHLFRFDGIKLFLEATEKKAPIKYVFLRESDADKHKKTVESKLESHYSEVSLYILPDEVFSKLTDEQAPEGIITVCSELSNIVFCDGLGELAENIAKNKSRVILLESVRDAGNMGTIIRTAKAFGTEHLIVSSDCTELYNPKTVRGAMGALFTQKIIVVGDICTAIAELRSVGVRVFATALRSEARRLGAFELSKGDAMLIGNEGHGLTQSAIDACDECLYIPMEEGSESLNASIAASVCMWEQYRAK